MKEKKPTKVFVVKSLMDAGKSAKEIAKETGFGLATVYNYMTRVRKASGSYIPKYKPRKKKLTPVNKTKRKYTKRVDNQADHHKNINGAQVLISKNVDKLQAEVFKLNDWCLQWRQKVVDAETLAEAKYKDEISRLSYMVCDKDAVIAYLEDKLVQVFNK